MPSYVPSGAPYGHPGAQGPTCFQKMKMGAFMGAAIGAASGLLFGGFAVLGSSLVGRQRLAMVGKYIIGSGASFSVFMAIGQGIRC